MKLHFNQDYILLRILDTFAQNVQDNEKHLKIDKVRHDHHFKTKLALLDFCD